MDCKWSIRGWVCVQEYCWGFITHFCFNETAQEVLRSQHIPERTLRISASEEEQSICIRPRDKVLAPTSEWEQHLHSLCVSSRCRGQRTVQLFHLEGVLTPTLQWKNKHLRPELHCYISLNERRGWRCTINSTRSTSGCRANREQNYQFWTNYLHLPAGFEKQEESIRSETKRVKRSSLMVKACESKVFLYCTLTNS